ncbi:hypothetical protein SARC_10881, partial [Sphaeroforma arctica JP610]
GSQTWNVGNMQSSIPAYNTTMNTSFGGPELLPLSAQLQPQMSSQIRVDVSVQPSSGNDMGGITISSPRMSVNATAISAPVNSAHATANSSAANVTARSIANPVVVAEKVATPTYMLTQQALIGGARGVVPNISTKNNPAEGMERPQLANPSTTASQMGSVSVPAVLTSTSPPLLPSITVPRHQSISSTPGTVNEPVANVVTGLPPASNNTPIADANVQAVHTSPGGNGNASVIHTPIAAPQTESQAANTEVANTEAANEPVALVTVSTPLSIAEPTAIPVPLIPASGPAPPVASEAPTIPANTPTHTQTQAPIPATDSAARRIVPAPSLPVGTPVPVQVPVQEAPKVAAVSVSDADATSTSLPVSQQAVNTPEALGTSTGAIASTDASTELRIEASTIAPQPQPQPLTQAQSQEPNAHIQGQPQQQQPQQQQHPVQHSQQQVPPQPHQPRFYGQLPGVAVGRGRGVKTPSGSLVGSNDGGKVNYPASEKGTVASGLRVGTGSPVTTSAPVVERDGRGPPQELGRVPSHPASEYRPVSIAPFPTANVKVGSPPAHHSIKNSSGTPVHATPLGSHAPPPAMPKPMKRPYYKPISAAPGPGSGLNTRGVGGEQRNVQAHQHPHATHTLTQQLSQGEIHGPVDTNNGSGSLPTQQPPQPPQPKLPSQQQGPALHPRTPIAAASSPGRIHHHTQQQQLHPQQQPPPQHIQPQRQQSSGGPSPHGPSGSGEGEGKSLDSSGRNILKSQTSQPSAQPTSYLARPAPPPVGSSLAAMAPMNAVVHVSSNSLSNSTERDPQQQPQQQADEQQQLLLLQAQQQRSHAKGAPQQPPTGQSPAHHGGYRSMGSRQHSGHLPYNSQQHMGRPGSYPEQYPGPALAGKASPHERLSSDKNASGPKTPGAGPNAPKLAPTLNSNANSKGTPPGNAYTNNDPASRPPYSTQPLQRGSSGTNVPPTATTRGAGFAYDGGESVGASLSGGSSLTNLNTGSAGPGEPRRDSASSSGRVHPDAGKFFPQLSESELDNIPHQPLTHPVNGAQQQQTQGPPHVPHARSSQTQHANAAQAQAQKIVPSQQLQKQQLQQQHSMQYTMGMGTGPGSSRAQVGPGRRRSGTGTSPAYSKAQEQAMQQQQVHFHTNARGIQREYVSKGKRVIQDETHAGAPQMSGTKRSGPSAGRKHGATGGEQQGASKRARRCSYSENEFDTVDEDAEHHMTDRRPVFKRKRPSIIGHQPRSFFTQRDPEVTGGINVPGHYLKPTLFRAPDEEKKLKRMLKGASTDGRLEGKRMKMMMQKEGLGQVLEIENRVTETLNKLQESLDKMTSSMDSDGRNKNGINNTRVDVAVNRLKSLVEKNMAASKTVTGHTKDVAKLSEKLMNHEPTCKLLVKQYALGLSNL